MKPKTIALWLGAAVAVYVGIGVWRAGDVDVPPPSTIPVTFTHGKARAPIKSRGWSLDYDKITTTNDQTVLTVQGVKNGVFYKKGKPYLHLRADLVAINTATHDLTISGPLSIATLDEHPRRFASDAANWTQVTQQLHLPKKVTVTGNPGEPPITLGSLVFDMRTGDIHVENLDGSYTK